MTEYTLAAKIGCTPEEAREIIDDYFRIVPRVKALLDGYGKQARKDFVAYTLPPIRRPRYFDRRKLHYPNIKPAKILGEIERAGKNSPVQGSNSDWLKIALVLIYEHIQKHKVPVKLRMVIHDQVITTSSKGFAEKWAEIQAQLMEQAGKYIIKSIPVKTDTKVTECWIK